LRSSRATFVAAFRFKCGGAHADRHGHPPGAAIEAGSCTRWRRITLAGCSLAISFADASAAEFLEVSGRAMGTTWSVKFVPPTQVLTPASVERAVTERLEELEQIFSTYRPQSEVSRFSASTGTDWVPVTAEMAHVADASRRLSALTKGAYDVTVGPLVRLWGFSAERRSDSLPTPGEIAAARRWVDWRALEVRTTPPALRKTEPRLNVDFSSMAKGFSVDAISELLATVGAIHHLVRIGGDMKARGAIAGRDGWRVGIERPVDAVGEVANVVTLNSQALSTSGDYRNYIKIGQRQYGHIIDPRTGEPASSSLAAVSVVHTACASSSALATALFVLGPEEGFRLAKTEGLACVFFIRTGASVIQRATPAFEALPRSPK
jgi:thiamine biosynthesis lipoprotein